MKKIQYRERERGNLSREQIRTSNETLISRLIHRISLLETTSEFQSSILAALESNNLDGGSISIGLKPPTNPVVNDIWIEITNPPMMYIRLIIDNVKQWISLGSTIDEEDINNLIEQYLLTFNLDCGEWES
jgi:hypothetical protein